MTLNSNGTMWKVVLPVLLVAALGWMSWMTVRIMIIESNRFTMQDGRRMEVEIKVVRAELASLQRLPVQPWLLDRMSKLETQIVALQVELRRGREE